MSPRSCSRSGLRSFRRPLAALVGLALLAAPALRAQAMGDGEPGRRDRADELWREQVLQHGDVDRALEELGSESDREGAAVAGRIEALELGIELLRRQGELSQALEWTDRLIELRGTAEDRMGRARLLDATGDPGTARQAYQELLDSTDDPALAQRLRLRLALLAMELNDEGSVESLKSVAGEEAPEEFRNRAAIVLALLEHPQQAIELYQVEGEGTPRFRSEVRIAEWAIRSGDFEAARAAAWSAVRNATLRRDRDYALTVLVEACRAGEALDQLVEEIAVEPDPSGQLQSLWMNLLRETGRTDEAIERYRQRADAELGVEARRDLLDLYREAGREDEMVVEYQRLIEAEPRVTEWAEGLSRYHLESGDAAAARAVWRPYLEGERDESLRSAAEALGGLGQDDLALACVERCLEVGRDRIPALLYAFGLHHQRGRLDEAREVLRRIDERAPPEAAERYSLSEAWEQIGDHAEAVRVLEGVVAARGAEAAGEDTAMRLAWLYSEMGDEDRALEAWRELWQRVQSIPRRRYVEDRMMTVAARLGKLADLAIELEERLLAGEAAQKDTGLLVRLYSKVQDAVSAAEVIDEFLESAGGDPIEALQEKARVYLACTDYYNYERTVRLLIEADPEGEPDYLRQLAMSQLERGRPDEAREVLHTLAAIEGGSDSSEFEAGVLSLAGMRDEAIVAYRQGIARFPDRIESYLLMTALMKEVGQLERAVGVFQHLAETAEKDDLFTIAIDGLLNLEASPRVLEWARRITLERLAERHDKSYLYQLLCDLAEQVEDREGMLVALENSLPIAASRRSSVLRELMDLSRADARARWNGDTDRHLAFGRRLIGLSELVPPQVYLDLGEAFLQADDVRSAAKTFSLARDLPDWEAFQRQSAQLFEQAGFVAQARRTYQHVLVSRSLDVGLMAKVGELHEQLGADEAARRLYERGIELLLSRQPVAAVKKEEDPSDDPFYRYYGARNVDDFDQHFDRLQQGLLTTADSVDELLNLGRGALMQDLGIIGARREAAQAAGEDDASLSELRRSPRILHRAAFLRRVARAHGHHDFAQRMDGILLDAFPEDGELLEELVRERSREGRYAEARRLIDDSGRDEAEKERVRFLAGAGVAGDATSRVGLAEAIRLVFPALMNDRREEARSLLRRVDYGDVEAAELGSVGTLFSAARWLDDEDALLQISRQWLRLMVAQKTPQYQLEPVLNKCEAALGPEHHRSVCEYFVGLVLEKPDENSQYLTLLPSLQEPFERPLLSTDQIFELIENFGSTYAFGLAPVIQLLPVDERAAAVREIWPQVQNTRRALFLMQLLQGFTEPMGDDLAEFVVGSMRESLDDDENVLRYSVRNLWTLEHNHDVALRLAAVLREKAPDDWKIGMGELLALQRLDREPEALQKLPAVLEAMSQGVQDYNQTQAHNLLRERFLPQHLDLVFSALDDIVERSGTSLERTQLRIGLVDREQQPEEYARALEEGLAAYPDAVPLLNLARTFASVQGRRADSLEYLRRLVEAEPRNRRHAVQVVRGWQSQEHWENALAAMDEFELDADEMRSGGGSAQARLMVVGGVVQTVMPGTGKKVPGKLEPTSVVAIKEAADAGEEEAAGRLLRRLWRSFPVGESSARNIIIVSSRARVSMPWPEDEEEDAEEDEDEPLRRGGLESFLEEIPERPTPRDAYEVLAGLDFGYEELQRLLRTRSGDQLGTVPTVVEGLRKAREQREGPGFFEDLVTEVGAGRGGKVEALMLLAGLDERAGELDARHADVLGRLIENVDPQDGTQLRRLARVHARVSQTTMAQRLFRWCATKARTGYYYSPFEDDSGITAEDLVEEVEGCLEGEARVAVVDTILDYADPGVEQYGSRQQWEVLALRTWLDLLGAEEAARRGEEICARVLDVEKGLRRQTASYAAELFLARGELESALRCLEVALCTFPRSEFESSDPYLWYRPEYPGYLGHDSIRRLFPVTGGPLDEVWLPRAAEAMDRWMGEGRVRPNSVAPALAVIVRRLAAAGRVEEAREVCARLEQRRASLTPALQLWLADAWRETGAEDEAFAVERRLLAEQRLSALRLDAVLAAVAAREGASAALALGEPLIELTRREDFLGRMRSIAAEAADGAAEARWGGLLERSKAAQAEFEARLEEESGAAR